MERSERWRGRRQYLLSHKSKSREQPVQASSCRVAGSELCWSCPLACLKRLPVEGNDNCRFHHTCEVQPHSLSYVDASEKISARDVPFNKTYFFRNQNVPFILTGVSELSISERHHTFCLDFENSSYYNGS